MEYLPFAEEHLDAAAALLAARHRADRGREPSLPTRFEDPAETRGQIAALLAEAGAAGVAALADGRLVGYLVGASNELPPDHFASPFVLPRSASIPYAGHAVAPAAREIAYHGLYAVLAGRWRDAGRSTHEVSVPAGDQAALDVWFALGFGRTVSLAVRDTGPVAAGEPRLPLAFRQATPADEPEIVELVEELFRTFDDPPIMMSVLPETWPDLRERVCELLTDPGCAAWLAIHDGRVAGLQTFETPSASRWNMAPLVTPERSLYLFMAATSPEARSLGVGSALLARTMSWAREAGFGHCTLHFLSTSRAAFFWQGHGFRPLLHGLRRTLDPRAAARSPC